MMIILKLSGGLGNQLFQVAFAYRLAKEYNDEIYVDKSWYKSNKLRQYSLEKLVISQELKEIEKNRYLFHSFLLLLYRVVHKINKIVFKRDYLGKKIHSYLFKKGLYFNLDRYYYPPLLSKKKVRYIYGYFQSEKYFKDVKKDIIEKFIISDFNIDATKYLNTNSLTNSVGISMRLGQDYTLNKSLNICKDEYYHVALKKMLESSKNMTIFIFSDDIDLAKKIFNGYDFNYVSPSSDIESLTLLTLLDNFIIPNSSFSWWASYLSKNKNKIIYAPYKWYNDSSFEPDIYYAGITKVHFEESFNE